MARGCRGRSQAGGWSDAKVMLGIIYSACPSKFQGAELRPIAARLGVGAPRGGTSKRRGAWVEGARRSSYAAEQRGLTDVEAA